MKLHPSCVRFEYRVPADANEHAWADRDLLNGEVTSQQVVQLTFFVAVLGFYVTGLVFDQLPVGYPRIPCGECLEPNLRLPGRRFAGPCSGNILPLDCR
jgi:hypothetical protein